MVRAVKRETGVREREETREGEAGEGSRGKGLQGVTERRVLRSRYLAVRNLISDEREDISRVDSDKFNSIISEVENLHHLVQKPREQVADAEALLDIANTLVTSVRSQSNDGVTPADFVTALLRNFGQRDGRANVDSAHNMISWAEVGIAVSHISRKVPGCCTMIGPMSTQMKQRKAVVHRKPTRPTENSRPEELDEAQPEEKTDTDKNMATMFNILRKKRRVGLQNLVLNRVSFAQTVENIFALSFLVKDGRAEISVNDGHHFVSPRNAPAATAVASGDVSYNHFVFRFDFKDWKLMMDSVGSGEELMPHRSGPSMCSTSLQAEPPDGDSQSAAPSTPIRKLTRNRGLIIQEETVVEDTPEKDPSGEPPPRRKGRRLCVGP
ncbi:non-structural maintenance of chromosomes element 4 homolog A [Phoenix dactylifera]|uniref:Non-structural maintenance of chromosomes element 4 n=1 Tax=Phoenix dactylifera TaxID=42345 RepID=A0A8B7CWV5_PHODC|nr:non-structural maintenance of chromosomes element 4 homolog A [Phoenix dactylifera]XP_008808095.1 non-structural maintenance of chromosomes element 4 homolog A [Phoenix dactylifera]